ncbi:MAG: DUF692 family multinuclear iron-containing protein [Thermoplasmatota archaeon]
MVVLPFLGVGIGYRSVLHTPILQSLPELDFLEVISDSFFRNETPLHALSTLLPCVAHSLDGSVGSHTDPAYVEKVRRIVAAMQAPWHSDHLAFTHAGGLKAGHLAPIPYNDEALEVVVGNVRRIQAAVPVPFALENITMPFYWPTSTMQEHEFLSEVVARTGCHLLLDLENARINAANHGGDARRFIDNLPLEKVAQVHLAGGISGSGLEHDSHSEPVGEATWGLLEYLCQHVRPPAVLVEHDAHFPPFEALLQQVRRARSIVEAAP